MGENFEEMIARAKESPRLKKADITTLLALDIYRYQQALTPAGEVRKRARILNRYPTAIKLWGANKGPDILRNLK